MAEVVDGDISSCKSANIGKRKQPIKGDGRIDVPSEFDEQLHKYLRNKTQHIDIPASIIIKVL